MLPHQHGGLTFFGGGMRKGNDAILYQSLSYIWDYFPHRHIPGILVAQILGIGECGG